MATSSGVAMDRTDEPAAGAASRPNLFGLDREDLASALAPLATRPFQAAQIYHWLHGRLETDPAGMTDLPESLRRVLRERFRIEWPSIKETRDSADGSRKYVLALEDGGEIETVYIV